MIPRNQLYRMFLGARVAFFAPVYTRASWFDALSTIL